MALCYSLFSPLCQNTIWKLCPELMWKMHLKVLRWQKCVSLNAVSETILQCLCMFVFLVLHCAMICIKNYIVDLNRDH